MLSAGNRLSRLAAEPPQPPPQKQAADNQQGHCRRLGNAQIRRIDITRMALQRRIVAQDLRDEPPRAYRDETMDRRLLPCEGIVVKRDIATGKAADLRAVAGTTEELQDYAADGSSSLEISVEKGAQLKFRTPSINI